MTEAIDFLCLASSPRSFICNEKPAHEGDHIAWGSLGGEPRRECDRWPRESVPSDARGDQ